MSDTLARAMVRFVRALDLAQVPQSVVAAAKAQFLDALGVGLAAASLPESGRWAAVLPALGSGGRSTALGQAQTVPAAAAALLNGALIHSLEYDGTHAGSIVHGAAVIAPAALAVAEAQAAGGRDLLRALIAGSELFIRLGLAAPGRFQSVGFQITAVGGPFVAAAMTALLEGADEATAVNALGIAGSQASGVFEFLSDGASVKALHPGWAAHAGIIAARLAACGMTGPSTIFEGRYGFYRTFARDDGAADRLRGLIGDLGRVWHLAGTALKAYPCCHYIHPFLECLTELVSRAGGAERVRRIMCSVPVEEAPLIADPWPRKQRPTSGYDAKWSLPYCLAALLMDGDVGVETFRGEPRPDILARAAQVEWQPWSGSGFPARFPAAMDVRLASGETLRHDISDVRGGPGRPFSAEAVRAKFRANARRRLADAAIDDVMAAIEELEHIRTLSALSSALRCIGA